MPMPFVCVIAMPFIPFKCMLYRCHLHHLHACLPMPFTPFTGMLTYGSSSQTRAAQRQSIQQCGQHSRPGREHQLPPRLTVVADAAQHACCWCHVPDHIAGQTPGCDLQVSCSRSSQCIIGMQHDAGKSQEPPVLLRLLVPAAAQESNYADAGVPMVYCKCTVALH